MSRIIGTALLESQRWQRKTVDIDGAALVNAFKNSSFPVVRGLLLPAKLLIGKLLAPCESE
jgi:hypothetical protein